MSPSWMRKVSLTTRMSKALKMAVEPPTQRPRATTMVALGQVSSRSTSRPPRVEKDSVMASPPARALSMSPPSAPTEKSGPVERIMMVRISLSASNSSKAARASTKRRLLKALTGGWWRVMTPTRPLRLSSICVYSMTHFSFQKVFWCPGWGGLIVAYFITVCNKRIGFCGGCWGGLRLDGWVYANPSTAWV